MEEVQKQIGPLTMTVNVMDKTLRSLYSNGSGGPPGYLETARAEDKRTLDALMRHQELSTARLEKVESSLKDDKVARDASAQVLADQVEKHDKAFKRRLGWATAVLTILQILSIAWDHRISIWRSLSDIPTNPVVQSVQPMQHALDK